MSATPPRQRPPASSVSRAMRFSGWVFANALLLPMWWSLIPLYWVRCAAARVLGPASTAALWLDRPHHWYLHWWSRIGLAMLGVRTRVEGGQYLGRKAGSAPRVYVFNHVSNVDPVMVSMMASDARFVMKKDLMALWFYVVPAWMMGHIVVDRRSATSKNKCLDDAIALVRDRGISVSLAPEGTRNKTLEQPVLEFKRGAFVVAHDTRCDLVPLVCFHNEKLFAPGHGALPCAGFCDLRVLPPVRVESGETAEDLSTRVRSMYLRELANPPPYRPVLTLWDSLSLHLPSLLLLSILSSLLLAWLL